MKLIVQAIVFSLQDGTERGSGANILLVPPMSPQAFRNQRTPLHAAALAETTDTGVR